MRARPGRPPKAPEGTTATITLLLEARIKQAILDSAEALDMSMAEYISTLVRRDLNLEVSFDAKTG